MLRVRHFSGAPNPFFRLQNYVHSSFFSGSSLVLTGETSNVNKNLVSRRHDFLAKLTFFTFQQCERLKWKKRFRHEPLLCSKGPQSNFYKPLYRYCALFLPNLHCSRKDLDAPLQKWLKMGLWKKNYVEVEYWTK